MVLKDRREKKKKLGVRKIADAKMWPWEGHSLVRRPMIMLALLKQTILEFQENFRINQFR